MTKTHNEPRHTLIKSVTGVVLAGGRSSRMGADKSLLRVGERTLTERCVAVLRECFASNIVIANRAEAFEELGLTVFPDAMPGLGPIGGLQTALRHVGTPALFLVACDMPFLNADLIREMARLLDGDCDAVVAGRDGQYEPLHAVYRVTAQPIVEAQIAAGDYSLQHLLGKLRLKILPDETLRRYAPAFVNVNTPEELDEARKRLH